MAAEKKKSKNRVKKVLYISRFRFRYELAEDVRYDRKSPLLYTKDFVGSGCDDESCSYWRQLLALRSKPNWLELRGAFAELKNVAGNMGKAYRGFLLDSNFRPASEREIGRWLGVNEKRANQIIAELEDVGLLEKIDLPEFDIGDDQRKHKKKHKPKKRKKPNKKKKAVSKQTRCGVKNSGRARERTEDSGSARARTGTHGNARAPLKKNGKAKANANVNVKDKVDNGNAMREVKKRQTYIHNSLALECQSKRQAKPATKEASPIKPQLSASSGGRRVIGFSAPPTAVDRNRNQPQRLGDIIEGMKHRWDLDAKQFGCDIYRALKLPWDPASSQGKRELTCFASVWMKAKRSGISPPVLGELHRRAVQEAEKISNRKSRCGNVSAVFCHVFARLVAARCVAARTELGGCG